ncbi:MAG: hypothetical protein GY708_02420 [Actinomycetia bacterium]|nr:hypothetical protein [Actinomycetes bacterium]MCP4961256.1 hypothetical protein [Actinomycetes bacterium]
MNLLWFLHFAQPTTIDEIADLIRSSPGLYRMQGVASFAVVPAADGSGSRLSLEVETEEGRTYLAVQSLSAEDVGPPAAVARSFKLPEVELDASADWLFEVEASGPDETVMFGTLGYLLGWDRFDGGWLTAEAHGYSFFSRSRGWIPEPNLESST